MTEARGTVFSDKQNARLGREVKCYKKRAAFRHSSANSISAENRRLKRKLYLRRNVSIHLRCIETLLSDTLNEQYTSIQVALQSPWRTEEPEFVSLDKSVSSQNHGDPAQFRKLVVCRPLLSTTIMTPRRYSYAKSRRGLDRVLSTCPPRFSANIDLGGRTDALQVETSGILIGGRLTEAHHLKPET